MKNSEEHALNTKFKELFFIVFLPLALVEIKNKTRRHGYRWTEVCSQFVGLSLM
jgi:hypothetical protein